MEKETQMTTGVPAEGQATKEERFEALLDEWIKDKDPNTMKAIAKLANTTPAIRDRMARIVNFYEEAINKKISSFTNGGTNSPLINECMLAGCQKLRDELGYKQGNALEQITIEHIVTCWLDLSINEVLLAQQTRSQAIEQMQRRIEFSAKRFNRAMLTLSKMRKMNLIIQVNTAEKQVVKNG